MSSMAPHKIVHPAVVSGPQTRRSHTTNILLASFFSVRTVNYGSAFFSINLWPKRESMEKTRSVIQGMDRKLSDKRYLVLAESNNDLV